MAGENEERDDDVESVFREAHETWCSPCKTGPAILVQVILLFRLPSHCYRFQDLLGIPIKLPTLVDAENQVNLVTGSIRLIENAFIVLLSCP